MKFARRNRSVSTAKPGSRNARKRGAAAFAEPLEPRVLLTASTIDAVNLSWGGASMQAARNQYVVTSSLGSAAALRDYMWNQGLHPTVVQSLAVGGVGGQNYLVVDSTTPLSAVNWYAQNKAGGIIGSIAPNFINRPKLTPLELSPVADWGPDLWHLNNTGAISTTDIYNNTVPGKAGADIRALDAWDLGTGTMDPIVAVLDTGAATATITSATTGQTYQAHPDLALNAYINPGDAIDTVDNDGNGVIDDLYGANFTTTDANGAIVPDGDIHDAVGHGTHVAGIIGAVGGNMLNDVVEQAGPPQVVHDYYIAAGINWRVRIMPVKVLDDTGAGTDAMIIAGLNYVTYMKQILRQPIIAANLSLGRPFSGPTNGLGDAGNAVGTLQALQSLNNAGVITTIAAGNDAWDIGTFHDLPGSYSNSLNFSVAATDASDNIATFSNFGGAATIGAPGEAILSTISDASTITDIYNQGPPHNPYPRAAYAIESGTSMAAPMVAGAAALLKSILPSASPQQIVDAIYAGSDKLPQLAGKVSSSGRLNVFRAAEILLGNRPVIASVDSVTGTSVNGWAFDPNMGAKPNTGYVLVDGVTRIDFTTNVQRPDVDQVVYNDPGRQRMGTMRGFSVPLGNIGPGQHRIDVYINDTFEINGVITNPDGTFIQNPWLVKSAIIEGNQLPIGNLDVATSTQIAGWAWDPNSNGQPIQVRIDIDGNQVAIVPANQFHSPAVGSMGFFYTPNLSQGIHVVSAYAIDDFTGQPVLIGTKTVFSDKALQYTNIAYDAVNRVLSGYVVDPDSPFDPVSMQITIDGPNGQRQYLQDAANIDDPSMTNFLNIPGNTKHKFTIQLPNVSPGNHLVNIYAFDNETGAKVELLGGQTIINNAPPTGTFAVQNASNYTGTARDPNSPGTPLWYRVDIYSSTGTNVLLGQIAQTTANGAINVTTPYTLQAGVYGFQLWAADAQSYQMRAIGSRNITVGASTAPTGALNAPIRTGQGISGTALDTATTAQTFVKVDLYVNNVLAASKQADIASGGAFAFTAAEIATAAGGPGDYHIDVRAEDVQGATPDTLLGGGEYVVGGGQVSGAFTNVSIGTTSGLVRGQRNDTNPLFVLNVNNDQFNAFTVTPNGTTTVPFTANTPLRTISNNVMVLQYFDPVTGALQNLATTTIPLTPANAFVNQRLVITGNFLPAGNLDSASANGIAGWVRDADAIGTPILYRLDYDNNIGITQTASAVRNDLPFTDKNHGFLVTPPLLQAGAHTVKLWAIDPATLQAVLVTQRSFTVLDDANRRPFGVVDVLTGSRIAGWVQDPSTPTWAVGIEVRVDGTAVTTVPASTPRPDVFRNGANAMGFDFAMPASVAAGRHVVEVYAVDTQDNTRKVLLKSSSLEVGTPTVAGSIEVADFTQIAGWAKAAANDATPKFRLDINNVAFQTFTPTPSTVPSEAGLNLLRFAYSTPPLGFSSNNTVSLYYIDPNTKESILVSTFVISPVKATTGSVDTANTSLVQGWAWSPSLPNALVKVQLIVDNVELAVTTASLQRPDLTAQLAGHAYQFAVPTLTAGRHTLSVRFRDPVTGDYSLVSTTSIVTA